MKESIGDVDLLVAGDDAPPVMDAFVAQPSVSRVLAHGDAKTSIVTDLGLQVDLRVVPEAAWGAAMIYFTGSKAHNIRIREMAVRAGLKLNEYGLFDAKSGELLAAETEEDVYGRLGMASIEPTLREDRGEVEAALAGELPELVTEKDLQGDLHTHTNLTDGLASLEDMVARAAGFAVPLLRDHRPRAEPVHAADDRRQDPRPARACGEAAVEVSEDDAAARHRAEHRSGRERRLGRGVPGRASTSRSRRCTPTSISRGMR